MTDPNPAGRDEETIALHGLYREIADLIRLREASKAPRIVIDGDIILEWPEEIKTQITTRIAAKKASISEKVEALQNGE